MFIRDSCSARPLQDIYLVINRPNTSFVTFRLASLSCKQTYMERTKNPVYVCQRIYHLIIGHKCAYSDQFSQNNKNMACYLNGLFVLIFVSFLHACVWICGKFERVGRREMLQEKYVSAFACVLSKEGIIYGAGIIVTIKREVNIFMDFFMAHFNCIQLFLMSWLAWRKSHSA